MKGQDVLLLLKLLCHPDQAWTYAGLAHELGMSPSEVHAAAKRCLDAGLLNRISRGPNRMACLEFILHGLRYVFPASPGPMSPGLPTSYAAPPLSGKILFDPGEAPVMPLADGVVRGPAITPIYRSAPAAASRDAKLHEMLALVDALRTGRARERKLAAEELQRRIQ
ncbi:MAG: hypothetical protein AB1758_10040 [Candidatus Eremiobacterota bacterium]